MSEHIIYLISGENNEAASVTYGPRDGRCHIVFRYRGRVIKENAPDYFEAFCQVRRQLELEKLIPFCYGASLNVFPSGMCRDMGAGMQAYRMTIGKHVDPRTDLVGIFEDGSDVIPATVDSQKKFFEEWLNSKKA